MRRDSGELVGACSVEIKDMKSIFDLLKTGHARKRFAATAMNERSSRSHTILVLQVAAGQQATELILS